MRFLDGRLKRALASGFAAILSKGISSISLLVAIRLTSGVATGERYGAWLTLVTISSFLVMLDLGLGYSLLNFFSTASAKNNKDGAVRVVSSSFLSLCSFSSILIFILTTCYWTFPLSRFLNAENSPVSNEISDAIFAFGITFLLYIPLSLLRNINNGMQKGYRYSVIECVAALCSLSMFLFCIYRQFPLPELTVSLSCAPLIAGSISAYIIFFRDYPWLRPRLSMFDIQITRHLFREGAGFLIIQVAGSVVFYMDGILIARLFGLDRVASYVVPQQAYSLILMALGFVLMPFWPAYRDALSSGNLAWTRRVASVSIALTALASVTLGIFMFLYCDTVVYLLTGKIIETSPLLRAGFSVALVIYSCGNAYAMLLNALNFVYLQAVLGVFAAGVSIFSRIILSAHIGLEGIVWGNIFSYIICIVVPNVFWVGKVAARFRSCGMKVPE